LQLTTLNEELDEEVMTLHQANKLKTPENVSGRVEDHLKNIQKRYQKICTQIIQFNTLTHNRFPPAVNALQETFESLIASGKVEHETFAESTRRNHLNKEARVQEHRTIQRLLSKPLDPAATLSWYYDTCRLTQDSKRVTLQSVLSQIEHSCEAKDPETQALCRAQLEHLKKLLTDEPQLVHAHYHPSIQRHLQTCEKLLERLNNLA
jgi:DNA-binding ferritin-like protein